MIFVENELYQCHRQQQCRLKTACTAAKQTCIDVDDSFDDSFTKEDFLD